MVKKGSLLAVILALWFLPSSLFAQSSFFEGKTLTIIQGRKPGGLGDMRARALTPFLTKHIPGNPHVLSEFMPGGGGRKAANHLYNVVRPDGLTIANIGGGFVANAVLGEPGVKYDVDRMIYLGTANSKTSYVLLTRREAGLDSLEKLRAETGVRVGGQSVGHDIYINARLFVWLLDLKKPVFITGYSSPAIDAALLRGELDARTTVAMNLVHRNPEWIEKRLVDFHVIFEIPKGYRYRHPSFNDLPALESFTRTERERKALAMFRTFRLIGSPYILPPGTPREVAEVLKGAFRKAFKDPQLPAAWKKLTGEDPYPLLPEEQDAAIREVPRDPQIIDLFKQIAGADPLPPR